MVICVNINCCRNVQIRHRTKDGSVSYKSLCSRCYRASKGLTSYEPGVIPIKKDFCENKDSRLGFKCFAQELLPFQLDMDHIDGNHFNSDSNNIQTICRNCHIRKTIEDNDCNSFKLSAQRKKVQIVTENELVQYL